MKDDQPNIYPDADRTMMAPVSGEDSHPLAAISGSAPLSPALPSECPSSSPPTHDTATLRSDVVEMLRMLDTAISTPNRSTLKKLFSSHRHYAMKALMGVLRAVLAVLEDLAPFSKATFMEAISAVQALEVT
jgi:hypothetical protein